MHYLKMYHWPKPQTNLGTIWDGCGGVVSHQKTTQKWPKTTDSAGKKIFENLKVWNCKLRVSTKGWLEGCLKKPPKNAINLSKS